MTAITILQFTPVPASIYGEIVYLLFGVVSTQILDLRAIGYFETRLISIESQPKKIGVVVVVVIGVVDVVVHVVVVDPRNILLKFG